MRSRHTRLVVGAVVALVVALGLASFAVAGGDGKRGDGKGGNGDRSVASLTGYQEVPALNGAGRATLRLDLAADHIDFRLDYSGLSGPPAVAHVHVGQRSVSGGVSFFLCGGGGKPPCPAAPEGSISGTVVAADVIGPTAQGFAPADLASVLAAIRAGVAYGNMHTARFPGGEIRGQLSGDGDE
jgi:hypothetical protein